VKRLLGASTSNPDVVLTDIGCRVQGMEGVEIANELRSSRPNPGVIVLSQFAEPEYAWRCSSAVPAAYLLKDRLGSREQLVAAIGRWRPVAHRPQVVERLVGAAAAASPRRSTG
jgi:DNA-binding NarL/FixJ family response regulator